MSDIEIEDFSCPSCGESERVEADDNYCIWCGEAIQSEESLTALQKIMGSPEQAQATLDDLEGIEEDHEQSDSQVPSRWQFNLEIGESDLPIIREELSDLANGGE